jgi:hypothetical protein
MRWAELDWSDRRDIRAAPRVTIRDAQPGAPVRLVGRVRIAKALCAPLSGRACAGYRVVVHRPDEEEPLLDLSDARRFELEDETGLAVVEAERAVAISCEQSLVKLGGGLDDAPPALSELLDRHAVEGPSFWRVLRVAEHVLAADGQVVAYGFVDVEAGGASASYRAAGKVVVVRQPLWITDDSSLA